MMNLAPSASVLNNGSRVSFVVAVSVALAASCGGAIAADTGDAPISFGAATHEIVALSPFLGDVPADDNPPVGDQSALADDNDGLDDEGGVFDFPVLVQNGKSYDTNVFVTNPLEVSATLAGWIDFDGDGAFDTDEFSTAPVSAGAQNVKIKLAWPALTGVTTSFVGTTYARFRITTAALSASDAAGSAPDGEVEDYSLQVQLDSDGDELPDAVDPDNDNDGIPDAVEGITADTDSDGIPDYLDTDSDGDLIPDFIEAGESPLAPVDTDGDGQPDFLDTDSDNDGVLDIDQPTDDSDRDGLTDAVEGSLDPDGDGIGNSRDLDSDNDTIPDAIERGQSDQPLDTDGDGIADYLDLDSDNDGIGDIREANGGELNVNIIDLDNDGRVDDAQLTGINGYLDRAETASDSGVPIFAIIDSDGDGVRDFRDLDSDDDSVSDLLETQGVDTDSNGVLDSATDLDQDGFIDGGNTLLNRDFLADTDEDGIPDFQDADADGSESGAVAPENDSNPATPADANPDGAPDSEPDSTLAATPIVETGLSGGAGCSVAGGSSGAGAGVGVFFPAMLVFCLVGLLRRRYFVRMN